MAIPTRLVCVPLAGSFNVNNHSETLLKSCYIFTAINLVTKPICGICISTICISRIDQNYFESTILQECKMESLETQPRVLNNFYITVNDKNEVWPDKDVATLTSQLLSQRLITWSRTDKKCRFYFWIKHDSLHEWFRLLFPPRKTGKPWAELNFFVCFFSFSSASILFELRTLKKNTFVSSLMGFYLWPPHVSISC